MNLAILFIGIVFLATIAIQSRRNGTSLEDLSRELEDNRNALVEAQKELDELRVELRTVFDIDMPNGFGHDRER